MLGRLASDLAAALVPAEEATATPPSTTPPSTPAVEFAVSPWPVSPATSLAACLAPPISYTLADARPAKNRAVRIGGEWAGLSHGDGPGGPHTLLNDFTFSSVEYDRFEQMESPPNQIAGLCDLCQTARMTDSRTSESSDDSQYLSARPLSGTALALQDVLYAVAHLPGRPSVWRNRKGASSRSTENPLRLSAVLLVLYVEEVFEHKQVRILGLRKRAFYHFLQNSLRLYATHRTLEVESLVEAVATVDTTGVTTRMVQSPMMLNMCGSHSGFFGALLSSSSLARLHHSLKTPADDAEELAPAVNRLTRLFTKAILWTGILITVLVPSFLGDHAVACAMACIVLQWRHADVRQSWLVIQSPSAVLKASCAYMLVLMLPEFMLPWLPATTVTARP